MEFPSISSPINVFEDHLASSLLVPEDAPLFAWQTADSGRGLMMKPWFMDQCRKKKG